LRGTSVNNPGITVHNKQAARLMNKFRECQAIYVRF
jgi:hypothetical protein